MTERRLFKTTNTIRFISRIIPFITDPTLQDRLLRLITALDIYDNRYNAATSNEYAIKAIPILEEIKELLKKVQIRIKSNLYHVERDSPYIYATPEGENDRE